MANLTDAHGLLMKKAIFAAAGLIACRAAPGYLLCGSPAVHRDTVDRGPVGTRDDGGTDDARRGDGRSRGYMSRQPGNVGRQSKLNVAAGPASAPAKSRS